MNGPATKRYPVITVYIGALQPFRLFAAAPGEYRRLVFYSKIICEGRENLIFPAFQLVWTCIGKKAIMELDCFSGVREP